MPSEAVLRMRIEEAVREAERANKNRDQVAYDRAKAKYDAADKWLTQLEKTRNDKAILELEASAKNGMLSYAKITRVGVPIALMEARGWVNLGEQSGMRKMDSVHPSVSQEARQEDRDDAATDADGEHAEHGTGDECA